MQRVQKNHINHNNINYIYIHFRQIVIETKCRLYSFFMFSLVQLLLILKQEAPMFLEFEPSLPPGEFWQCGDNILRHVDIKQVQGRHVLF